MNVLDTVCTGGWTIKFSYTQNVAFVDHYFMWNKIALKTKLLLVSYPHFLKSPFKLTKCGLSYGFKRDLGPFSEFTRIWTAFIIDSPKWILEADIEGLEIQCWLKGENCHNFEQNHNSKTLETILKVYLYSNDKILL